MPHASETPSDAKKPLKPTLFHRLVNPSMDRQVQTNLRRMQSPAFAQVARILKSRLPAQASFGKFRQNEATPLVPEQTDTASPETTKGP